MDFLDSLDLQTSQKSNRMRSWYLYEQYKSLERHQLNAAEKLKNRSYQERLLQQELAERRSRRRMYQQYGLSLSEHSADSHGVRGGLSSYNDDFFESFCEVNDDFHAPDSVADDSTADTEMDKAVMEDFKSLDVQDDTSCAESINSVVEKTDNFDMEYKSVTEKLESVQRDIADKISQQLESVKENMLCLENYVRLSDTEDEEGKSARSGPKSDALKQADSIHDTSLFSMWSRLVSFAYQIIQLNHGNCYYDYSSQLMTAVLACDAIRRGVNSMCDILQPYVSPINYIEASGVSPRITRKKAKRKKYTMPKGTAESRQLKINSSVCKTTRSCGYKRSVNQWRRCSNSVGNKERRYTAEETEPWQRVSGPSSSSKRYWPKDREPEACACGCHGHNIVNPMLKLVGHLDNVLKSDIDYFVHR